MPIKMRNKNAFTLIELLVVVAIIGILAAVGLGQFHTAQKRGRDAQRKENLASITKALEMYYNDYEQYPLVSGGKIEVGGGAIDWGDEFTDGKTVYMKRLPKDPADNFRYFYETDTDRSYYKLYARIEHSGDICFSDGPCNADGYDATECLPDATDKRCNYCVASPNESCEIED